MTIEQAQQFLDRHERAKANSPAFVPVEVEGRVMDADKFFDLLRRRGVSENTAAMYTDWAVEEYCALLRTARLTVRPTERAVYCSDGCLEWVEYEPVEDEWPQEERYED